MGAAPELVSCGACAGAGEVDAGCGADALGQKTYLFGKPGVQGTWSLNTHNPQGFSRKRCRHLSLKAQWLFLSHSSLTETPPLRSERDPVMVQSDLLCKAGHHASFSELLVKLQHTSKKEKKKEEIQLLMELLILLYGTFCSPPLSWSSLNSLQLISNIPAQHWLQHSCADGSSTLHRDNTLPAPAQDFHVCVQVPHLLSGHCAQLGFCVW